MGTGLSEREIDRLQGLLAPLERTSTPFAGGSKPPRGAVFAEPKLVAEVRFSEWTRAGNLRHPSYVGLREDCLREVAGQWKLARRYVRLDHSVLYGCVSVIF